MLNNDISKFPCLKRWLYNGFTHNPLRDAPRFNMICLETTNQRVFINPETGYTRFGRTIPQV